MEARSGQSGEWFGSIAADKPPPLAHAMTPRAAFLPLLAAFVFRPRHGLFVGSIPSIKSGAGCGARAGLSDLEPWTAVKGPV